MLWLLDICRYERDVEWFSSFERLTLLVSVWLIISDNLFAGSAAGPAKLAIPWLSFFEGIELFRWQVGKLMKAQLPCIDVFSSCFLPVGACQQRAFDEVGTTKAGARTGPRECVNTWKLHRLPLGLRFTKLRAWLPSQRSDKWLLVCTCHACCRPTGGFADLTRPVKFFISNYRRFHSNFACVRS